MIRSSITVSLVPEARGGPFVFWDGLPAACARAAELGFDAIEIFPPDPAVLKQENVAALLKEHGLKLAAVGTGAGWVKHKLHLCLPEAEQRSAAREFVRRTIDTAGEFGAPAIIGSMQGRWSDTMPRDAALEILGEALAELSQHAAQYGVPLLYEPLNRYETNLANTLADGVKLVSNIPGGNARLLADLFHMNIEETDIPAAIRDCRAAGLAICTLSIRIAARPARATSTTLPSQRRSAKSATRATLRPKLCRCPIPTRPPA